MKADENLLSRLYVDLGRVLPSLVKGLAGIEEFRAHGAEVQLLPSGTLKKFAVVNLLYSLPTDPAGANPNKLHLIIKYRIPGKRKVPKGFVRHKARETEYEQYKFLGGTGYVPEAFLIEDIVRRQNGRPGGMSFDDFIAQLEILRRSIILRYVGKENLEEKMTGARGASTRIRLVKEIIRRHLIDFQQKATEQTNTEANRNVDLAWLCAERNIRERGEDYLRGSLGLESIEKIDPPLLELHREGFGVLAEVYDHGSQVLRICHGDLSTADVLEDREGPRRIWFTDPKLKIRDPVFDVATVLSSPGTRLSKKWDNLFRQFRVCLLDNTRDSYLKTLPFTTTKTEFFRERLFDPSSSMTRYDESQMLGFGTVVGLVNSYRNLARISDLERIFPEEYERTVEGRPALVEAKREMALNIKRALRRLIEEPEKYNITQGTARGADNLLNNVFIQTGIIQSQNEKDLRYFFDVTNPQSALQYLHGLKQKFEKSRTEEQRRISEEALGILDEYGEGTDFDTFRRFFQQQGEPDGSRPRIQPDRRLGFKIPRDKAPA